MGLQVGTLDGARYPPSTASLSRDPNVQRRVLCFVLLSDCMSTLFLRTIKTPKEIDVLTTMLCLSGCLVSNDEVVVKDA